MLCEAASDEPFSKAPKSLVDSTLSTASAITRVSALTAAGAWSAA